MIENREQALHLDSKLLEEMANTEMLALKGHPLYRSITGLREVRIFMQTHVLAVWDFMSLLKSLQLRLTSTSTPWTPSLVPKKLTRMINEVVLGEESDLDPQGNACDHFTLYLRAMEEVGASTQEITSLVEFFQREDNTDQTIDSYLAQFPAAQRNFLHYHLDLAFRGASHEVAAAFFYGREKVIPLMFRPLVDVLEHQSFECPQMIYYLNRHIELDGDEHSVLASQCLEILCGDDDKKWNEAMRVAYESLQKRRFLWDYAHSLIISSS